MKLITISGIDKSGKTTLVNAFNKATKYQHFVIEREPSAVRFFCELLNRPFNTSEYNLLITMLKKVPALHVFLYADVKTLRRRFLKHDEPALPGSINMAEHQLNLYQCWSNTKWKNPLVLNTDKKTIDECVQHMIEAINYSHFL